MSPPPPGVTPGPIGLELQRPAPKDVISIRRFIELVEKEEARYPPEVRRNTKLMITRLRKIFYGKKSWDEYLIEGAANIASPYDTNSVEKLRFTIPLDLSPDLDVMRTEYSVTDPTTGFSPMIARNQEIRLVNGSYIDIGHVFAGLDAVNFKQSVGPNSNLGLKIHNRIASDEIEVHNNLDAVTWVGDLGSVLAEVQFKGITKKQGPLTTAEINAIIREYASPQDMLGNIDAYVIKTKYDIRKASQGMKVSEILRRYYLTDPAHAREHRYSIFAEQAGLKGWNGSVFTNENKWIQHYADQVNDAAALYVGANTEGIAKYRVALKMASNKGAVTLVKLFLTALKTRIRSEPNGSGKGSR